MTTWTPDSSIPSDDYFPRGSLYVLIDYTVLGYFAEQLASTTWTPENPNSTAWTPA